jgi:hypothetical protein
LFYGTGGPASSPFQGGTLCVLAPIRRTASQSSGGTIGPDDCSGTFSYDFNALLRSGSDNLLGAGSTVHAQWWSRDPADPFTTSLSGGIRFLVRP